MVSFDFVSDDELRASLESDAVEMAACLEARAYKAVHVIAGSIVEALLVEHLSASKYAHPKGKDVREMILAELIDAARAQKILSDRAADLATVVKSYRNLIHPGRVVRLGETVDPNTAAIADSVVGIIADEVAVRKQREYGYTAQQIVSKVEGDPSSLTILSDLLKSTAQREVENLLANLLPTRYIELASIDADEEDERLPRLRAAYRAAFDHASNDVKKRIVKRYVRILREGSGFEVATWEEAFFRASDLAYMAPEDVEVAKKHLLSQLGPAGSTHLRTTLIGIGKHATSIELSSLVDHFFRPLLATDSPAQRRTAERLLERLWVEAPVGPDKAIRERMEYWAGIATERNRPDLEAWVRGQLDGMLEGVPF